MLLKAHLLKVLLPKARYLRCSVNRTTDLLYMCSVVVGDIFIELLRRQAL